LIVLNSMNKVLIILIFPLLQICGGCEQQAPEQSIPFAAVNIDINVTNLQYLDLQSNGGYVYLEGGYKGIIVYHEGGGVYRAFERACTFDPRSSCPPLVVDDSGLFLVHDCCSSAFSFEGDPTGGPASQNLLQYAVFVDGNLLLIRNQ
jgi:hypothetical protein